ncbi:MAG: hypothetical protein LBD60_02170 [Puniceicoccales bacterium]|nr:hypothetical protein [Puniceicoccales bacterium]
MIRGHKIFFPLQLYNSIVVLLLRTCHLRHLLPSSFGIELVTVELF